MKNSSLKRSGMAHVNEGSHSFTCHPHVYPQVEWTIPAFTPQLQSVTALWLALVPCPTEGRRLGWPGCLGQILTCFARLKMVTHPSTNRAQCTATSLKHWPTSLLHQTTEDCTVSYFDPQHSAERIYSIYCAISGWVSTTESSRTWNNVHCHRIQSVVTEMRVTFQARVQEDIQQHRNFVPTTTHILGKLLNPCSAPPYPLQDFKALYKCCIIIIYYLPGQHH